MPIVEFLGGPGVGLHGRERPQQAIANARKYFGCFHRPSFVFAANRKEHQMQATAWNFFSVPIAKGSSHRAQEDRRLVILSSPLNSLLCHEQQVFVYNPRNLSP